MSLAVVILAAGQGTRMKSRLPKVLHPLAGRPMISYAVDKARSLTDIPPVVVVGYGMEQVQAALGGGVTWVVQERQLGTGHACMQARPVLEGHTDTVLVLYGDMPLLTVETLSRLVEAHSSASGPITMLTVVADDPMGFGRILRDEAGQVVGIVEEAVATPEQLAIRELNVGVYCFQAGWLWPHLEQLPLSPKGEYFLTDLVGMAVAEGLPVQAITVDDVEEVLGINTRVHLARAETVLRRRINEHWMLEGVTLVDPTTAYIDATVRIGQDTVILPNTCLQGQTVIGQDCRIGPNTIIRDAIIGDRCRVVASLVEGIVLEDGADVGPFAHLERLRSKSAGSTRGGPSSSLPPQHLGDNVELLRYPLERKFKQKE